MSDEPKMTMTLAAVLICIAVFLDVVQAMLSLVGFLVLGIALNSLLSFFALMLFAVIFWIKGLSFFSSRRSARMMITIVSEMVPLINNLPAWTITTAMTIREIRKEEQERIAENKEARKSEQLRQQAAQKQALKEAA